MEENFSKEIDILNEPNKTSGNEKEISQSNKNQGRKHQQKRRSSRQMNFREERHGRDCTATDDVKTALTEIANMAQHRER